MCGFETNTHVQDFLNGSGWIIQLIGEDVDNPPTP